MDYKEKYEQWLNDPCFDEGTKDSQKAEIALELKENKKIAI